MFSSVKPISKLDKIQVLVLDGSSHTSDLLREVIISLGFKSVEVVSDGYEGIQAMRKKPIHLVITDRNLSVRKRQVSETEKASFPSAKDILPLSGAAFVKRLRHSPQSPNPFVPVLMLIREHSEQDIAEARDAGVNEILAKPLQANEICNSIMCLIDDKRHFITADAYKGPCRRYENKNTPPDGQDRRKKQIRLIRHNETV